MSNIKRASVFLLLFLLGTLGALAQPASARRFADPLLNDVVEMTHAGLSDATIIAYVKARRARLEPDLSADDLIRLREAGVPEPVVRYIAGAGGVQDSGRNHDGDAAYEGSASSVESYDVDSYGYPYGYSAFPYYSYGYAGYPYWYAYSPYFTGSFLYFSGRHGGHHRGRFIHSPGPGHFPRGHGGGRLHTVPPRGRR